LVTQEFVYSVTFITASSSYTVSVSAPTLLVRVNVYFWGSMMAALPDCGRSNRNRL
jgi:multiple sugar transport system permease protein